MNTQNTAIKHPQNKVFTSIWVLIIVLAAALPNTSQCRAAETTKENALRKAAQEWINVGAEQHKRSLFKAAERSFRRAAIYRKYLTDAERKELDQLMEQSANAAMAKELTSVGTSAADKLAPPIEQVDADKVVALDTKAVEVKIPVDHAKLVEVKRPVEISKPVEIKPQVRPARIKADSVKDGSLLTQKEWEYIAEKPVTTSSSFAKQVQLPARPASPVGTRRSTETAYESRIVFEPGDIIEVKFFYTPELDITQTVRPDGKISLQLIHEVTARGKTPEELRDELMKLYDPHLRAPEIAVVARSFFNQRVFVGGQVLKPGVVQMPGRMTALEAIMEVGGFDMRAAERKSVLVIRYTGGRRYAYKLDLKKAVAGNETKPFYLQPKDVVHVPRTKIAKLNQWIDQHINKIIPDTGIFFRRTNGDTTVGMGSYR